MNTKINPGSMISTKGFSIERAHRELLKYRTGTKSLTVVVEPGDDLAVYLSGVTNWDSPNESEGITEQEMGLIRDNIRDGLKFLRIKHSFE